MSNLASNQGRTVTRLSQPVLETTVAEKSELFDLFAELTTVADSQIVFPGSPWLVAILREASEVADLSLVELIRVADGQLVLRYK